MIVNVNDGLLYLRGALCNACTYIYTPENRAVKYLFFVNCFRALLEMLVFLDGSVGSK